MNAICPGIVDTPMLKEFIDAMPEPAASRREHERAQPLGPGDVVRIAIEGLGELTNRVSLVKHSGAEAKPTRLAKR